jgi:putative hydrolase of the HAD superfamily
MRALLFDFGGTLDYPRHWLDRFLSHYRAAGIPIERAELDLAFDAATRTAYQAGAWLHGYGLEELVAYLVGLQFEYLRADGPPQVRDFLNLEALDGTAVTAAGWIAGAFVAESREGLARSRDVLAALARRFKIGLVSNFYGNLDRIAAEAGFSDFIAAIADSGRLGIYKPDPAIFAAALDQIGVRAADAAVVGDSLGKDCEPARRLGMRTVWLRHHEFAGRSADGLADFTIDTLEDLEHLEWDRA